MIETEIKFLYEEEKIALLIASAHILGTKEITDVYYDDEKHSLLFSDTYLRERDGTFELKLPLQDNSGNTKSYQEIVENIHARLPNPLKYYAPFITVHTTRTSYETKGVRVDLDIAEINGKKYWIGELELSDETDAKERLNALIAEYNLTPITNGKVFLYIKDELPELYVKLVHEGIAQ